MDAIGEDAAEVKHSKLDLATLQAKRAERERELYDAAWPAA